MAKKVKGSNAPGSSRLPVHIGVIMDGNGRWAKARKKPRTAGHEEGLRAAKRIVKAASQMGVGNVTLYTFSTENWKRAKDEVSFLMNLIKIHLRKELDFYREHSIRVIASGDRLGLPKGVVREIENAEKNTAHFTGLTVNLAINYGGQDEIVRAVNTWLSRTVEFVGKGDRHLSAALLEAHLDQPALPPIDLVIRTGGEMRISNFYIWEGAYAELFFSRKLWPDWDRDDLEEAVAEFVRRERRFGDAR